MTLLKPLTALACSFMCILLSQHALAESKNEQFVLMITPQKCVALRQGLPCYAKVSLSWQGEYEDNVCLYRVANNQQLKCCLLYTSDAADDLLCVDLGGRRVI